MEKTVNLFGRVKNQNMGRVQRLYFNGYPVYRCDVR